MGSRESGIIERKSSLKSCKGLKDDNFCASEGCDLLSYFRYSSVEVSAALLYFGGKTFIEMHMQEK